MQLALVSDVHGNVEALEVVLAALDAGLPQARIICAGDLVGYGPDPEACLELLRARHAVMVMGNHEQMVLGHRDFSSCIRAGIVAALWTRRHLAPSVRSALEQLPAWADAGSGVVVCHGDLEDANTYVADARAARRALQQLRERRPESRGLVCGHTHHAAFFSETTGFLRIDGDRTLPLPRDEPYLVNPGAVGQSRDGKVRARYAVLDLSRSTVTYSSLPYDSESTLHKLRRSGLVAQVVYERPHGAARHVERARLRAARLRARRASVNGSEHLYGAPQRPQLDGPRPPRQVQLMRSTLRTLRVLAEGLTSSATPSSTATVLAYRAVTTAEESLWVDPRFATPVEVFEAQVEVLARRCSVHSLAKLIELLADGRPLPPNTVVITFDQGHRTVVDNAVPILRRHGLPATLYLPTAYVTHGKTATEDELFALFTWRTGNVLHLDELGCRPVSLYDPAVVRRVFLDLQHQLVAASWDERDRLLSEIRAQLRPARRAARATASWDELRHARELHPGIDIGVCTRNNVDLSRCPADVAVREIVDSVADVRNALGVEALDLAYPFNLHTHSTMAVARAAGLRSAAIVDPDVRVDPETDLFALPRIDAPRDRWSFRLLTHQTVSSAAPGLSSSA